MIFHIQNSRINDLYIGLIKLAIQICIVSQHCQEGSFLKVLPPNGAWVTEASSRFRINRKSSKAEVWRRVMEACLILLPGKCLHIILQFSVVIASKNVQSNVAS